MKIAQITAGTGSFYCGNCIRDNGLVLALRRRGHDALLVPLYLPTVPDDLNAAEGVPLFYGGINVYLQNKIPLFRYTPRWMDRWFDHPYLLSLAAKQAGMTKASELGEMTLATLLGESGPQIKELKRLAQWLRDDCKPDLICLSNLLLVGMARALKQETGVPVVCALQGEDGFIDHLPEPYRQQCWEVLRERAQEIDLFIPVSHYYAGVIRERLQLHADALHVVHNGISLQGYRPDRAEPESPTLGYLARLCPEKGFHTFVDVFIQLKQSFPDLKMRAAGVMTGTDPAFVETCRERMRQAGVEGDADIHPNVSREEKIRLLESLSVFSVPALYGESFGLYVIEALAAGVPVVQPRHAGFPEIIEATQGGVLYDGESPSALAEAIAPLLRDPAKARALGAAGRERVHNAYSDDHMAENIEAALQTVL